MLLAGRRWRVIDRFTSLAVGVPFSEVKVHIILGGEDGVVRAYCGREATPSVVVECKSGAITGLVLHNLVKLGTNDLIIGDTTGHVYIYTLSQLLSHATLSHGVTDLAIHVDSGGSSSLIAGDAGGNVTCLLPYQAIWRASMSELPLRLDLGLEQKPSIQSVVCAEMMDCDGAMAMYTVVADGSQELCIQTVDHAHFRSDQVLHFLSGGVHMFSLLIPSVVRTMCVGHFVNAERADMELDGGETRSGACDVAVGCDDGFVYIIHKFEVMRYGDAGYPLRHLLPIPVANGKPDLLVCGGLFNGVVSIWDGQVVGFHSTSDWVIGLAYGDIDNDADAKLLMGSRDGYLEALTIDIALLTVKDSA